MRHTEELQASESRTFTRNGLARLSMLTLALVLGVTGTLSVTGCETTEGAGRDIQSVGEGVEDVAN